MIRKLQKHGNSRALVFDKPMMEAMNISEDTPLQLNISANTLVVTPIDIGLGEEAVSASIRKLRPRYRKMLKKLAE